MARTRVLSLFAAVLFALCGCSAFFDFNAFSGLDKPGVPDPSRYQGSGGLSNLQQDLQSPAIVAALKGDPTTVAKILNNLASGYNLAAPQTANDQKAAILYSQLELQSTSGDVLVNNIVNTVTNNPSGNLQTLLASVVPSDVAASSTKFSDMVTGLLAAEVVYTNLGTSIPTYGVPPGMNMGDVAQKAAVALLMDTMITQVESTPLPGPGPYSQGQAISQMFLLINNEPNNVGSTNVPDPFSPMPGWLKNIFDAAGASYPP